MSDPVLVIVCFVCGGHPAHFVNPDAGWLCDACDPPIPSAGAPVD